MSVTPVQQIVVGDRNIFSGTGDVHVNYQLPPSEGEDRLNLLTLLNRVKSFWIDDRLEGTLHGVALLPLGKKTLPGAVEHLWETLPGESDLEGREIPTDKSIGRVFDEAGRLLLILGEAGSGKTTTLLELARGLIESAELDPTRAVPVVFHLSSWAIRRKPLFDWLVEELRTKYYIPPRLGRSFLTGNRVLPLLDGLDEVAAVHRPACVDAINRFAHEVGVPGLVVCSRFDDYSSLPRRLKVNGAVYLQPLAPERVDDYMAAEGQRLASLRTLLLEDDVLKTLAASPLMLDVMNSAYQDLPIEALRDDKLKTGEARREHVFRTYIARMFQRRGGDNQPHTREQMTLWLSWLARNMNRNSQNIFLIERLQPTWLSGRRQRATYLLGSRVAAGMLLAFAMGLNNLLGGNKPFGQRMGELFCYLFVGFSLGLFAYLLKSRQPAASGEHTKAHADPTRWHLVGSVITNMIVAGLTGSVITTFMGSVWLALNAGADAPGGQMSDLSALWLGIMLGSPLPIWAKGIIFMFWMAVAGILVGMFYGLMFGLVVGTRDTRRPFADDIQTAETMSWSLARVKKAVKWTTFWALVVGIVCGIASFCLLMVIYLFMLTWAVRQGIGPTFGEFVKSVGLTAGFSFIIFLYFAAVLSFSFGVIAALIAGMNTSRIVEVNSLNNHGIKTSLKNSVRAGLIVGIGIGLLDITMKLTLGFMKYQVDKLNYGEGAGEIISVPGALFGSLTWSMGMVMMAWLWYGGADIIKHYTLRAILYRRGGAPRRFDTFLEYAVGLGFMRKVGGGYIFMHSLLREHFAGARATSGEALIIDGD